MGLDMDLHGPDRYIVGKAGPHEGAVRGHGQGRRFFQPDVPINAGAFVKPALEPRRIHAHHQSIFTAELRELTDVVTETVVAVEMAPEAMAVEPHKAIANHAVEFQPKDLALVGGRQVELPAVPADVVGGKTFA